ncbi:MAG: hypothetical protein Q9201_001503 [Fulgogasparrea decipioides]
MEFSIEVPGEANPLSTQTLYRTLTAASSTDPHQITTGTQQLQYWEKQPGYYSALQSIFIDFSLPVEVRHLCIIQLKNGIDKYWRKTASNAIRKYEKDQIRSTSIESGIREPDLRLALQNAVTIAKIVRYEPDAISSIVSKIRSISQSNSRSLELTRALLILLEVIKELSKARLQRTRTSLQAAALEVLQVLGKIYVDKTQIWMAFFDRVGDDEGGVIDSIEQSLLALRVLRRLLVAAWDFPNRSSEVQDFWTLLNSQYTNMLALMANQSASLHDNIRRLVEKHWRQIAKLHLNLAQDHPAGFALLQGSIHLLSVYWNLISQYGETLGSQTPKIPGVGLKHDGDVVDQGMLIMEYLSLKGLQLLRACAKMVFNPAQTFKYQNTEDKEEKARSRELIRVEVLTESFAQTAMQTLITRFFVFRPQDLLDWEEQPEEWELREEGSDDLAEYSIRTCAEKLFLELILNYKMQLVHPLLSIFNKVANPRTTDIFLKDSIYGAIGLAAPVLEDKISFNTFLRETLAHEAQVKQPGCNILRRRIAIMLGQWLPVKDGLDRPLVYQLFQHMLDQYDPLNDLVVRITAGRQLKNIILPFEFDITTFKPYTGTTLSRLIALIEEVELIEHRLALLNTLTVLVQSMEEQITPFADQIISFLPPLWEQAGNEHLLKQNILAILSSLMSAMKANSQKYHQLIIPLIDSSVNVQSDTYVPLVEDALDLWEAVLQQTPSTAVPSLLPLVPRLFPIMEAGSDTLPKVLSITETYVYIAPHQMLSSASTILVPLTSLLNGSKREIIGSILNVIELLMRSALQVGGNEALTALTSHLLEAGLLQTVVGALHGAYEAHQSIGPNRSKTWLDVLVETDYLSLLSRLSLSSPGLLLDAVRAATPNDRLDTTIKWMLSEWFRHLDNISHPEKKKLNCLALTALLQTGQSWILSHLQDLMSIWTEAVLELYDEDNTGGDYLLYRDPDSLKGERETAEEERQRELIFADPIHQLDLKTFIREHMQHAITSSGGTEAFQGNWVVNVDRDVLEEFGKLGIF